MRERIKWIDVARGYGIILVIIGHLELPGIRNYIYTFHLPLFFFISGYLFERKISFRNFLKSKIKNILIPYFALSGMIVLFNAVYRRYFWNISNIWEGVRKDVIDYLWQNRASTLWFLTCLFLVNLIFWLLLKFTNSIQWTGLAVLILLVAGIDYYKYIGQTLPWNIDVSFMALPFFYAGFLFKNSYEYHRIFFKDSRRWLLLILFAIVNILCSYVSRMLTGWHVDMYGNSYGIISLTYIAAFAGIFFVIIISGMGSLSFIQYIGRYSLTYFALHQSVMLTYLEQIYNRLGVFQNTDTNNFERYLCAYVTFASICIVLTLFNELIRRSRLCFMIGLEYEKKHKEKRRANDDQTGEIE